MKVYNTTLYTTKQAAERISKLSGKPLSYTQLCHEIQLGNLKAQRIGLRGYLITEEAIQKYQRRKPGPKPKS